MKFYPYKKGGGAEKVLVMLKGGHKTFWGCFYAVALIFSHIEGGGRKKFQLFKSGGGTQKVLPCLDPVPSLLLM